MDLEKIRQEACFVAEELIETAQMKQGQILVVGCSSSEIHNSNLGTDSSREIGQAVFEALYACTKKHGLYLAAQCCEHLNRAVVLERAAAEKYGYEPVCAVPWLHGGGSFAMAAYYGLEDAVTVESIQAHAGIDIGDVLIGMASSGVHSNGFSLVRKIFKMDKETLNTYHEELGATLGETLLAPTRIYVKALQNIKKAGVRIRACSHITGGGFYENVPRMLPEGKHAVIRKDSYKVPPIFKMMAREGQVEEKVMYNTYNMGIGMVLAVDATDVDKTMAAIREAGDTPYIIGEIKDGEKGVTLC